LQVQYAFLELPKLPHRKPDTGALQWAWLFVHAPELTEVPADLPPGPHRDAMETNDDEQICYPQPRSTAARAGIAGDFVKRFHYEIPLLVDPIENPANAAYAAWPERLYIVDEQGRIVYKGGPGPFEFHPEEVEAWLSRRFPVSLRVERATVARTEHGMRLEGGLPGTRFAEELVSNDVRIAMDGARP
jgi:hypothetical protein